jgi:hypothetical protein
MPSWRGVKLIEHRDNFTFIFIVSESNLLSSKVQPNVGVRYEAPSDGGRFDKALAGTACGASADALLAAETEVLGGKLLH